MSGCGRTKAVRPHLHPGLQGTELDPMGEQRGGKRGVQFGSCWALGAQAS